MGAPRDPDVETEERTCPEHGAVEFRQHRSGTRNGEQRYRWRCPLCHSKAIMKINSSKAEA